MKTKGNILPYMKLVILNYSMNKDNLVFAHQYEAVLGLSEFFDKTDVLTADPVITPVPTRRIEVTSTKWLQGKWVRNIYWFYRKSLPILWNHRGGVLFSHMTEVQSLLAIPVCKALRIRHFLWYAHTSKSYYLRICNLFVDGILTSTSGSCPLKSKKVSALGQAIDIRKYHPTNSLPIFPPSHWYHVGRIDKSKNIETIIKVLRSLKDRGIEVSLEIIGAPSSSKNSSYLSNLHDFIRKGGNTDWVSFLGPISRDRIPEATKHLHGFIHAYQGSLDKAVLEATALGKYVVSANSEYLKEFGLGLQSTEPFDRLLTQLLAIYSSNQQKQIHEIVRRRTIIEEKHSLQGWTEKVALVIGGRSR